MTREQAIEIAERIYGCAHGLNTRGKRIDAIVQELEKVEADAIKAFCKAHDLCKHGKKDRCSDVGCERSAIKLCSYCGKVRHRANRCPACGEPSK